MAYEHIKTLMKDRGETQTDLGRIIHRTQAVLANLFKGTRELKLREVQLLAKHYKKTEHYIMYGREEEDLTLDDGSIALMDTMKMVLQVLIGRGMVTRGGISRNLTNQMQKYKDDGLPKAVDVAKHLNDFVLRELKEPESDVVNRLLGLQPEPQIEDK